MGRLRLGRTGAGLFRLHRGSGKHAAARVDGGPPQARHAFDPLSGAPTTWAAPARPQLQPQLQPQLPQQLQPQLPQQLPQQLPPPPPAAAPAPTVSLVLRDGRQLTLDAGDPRARTFVTVASEMLRFVPAHEITRSG